MKILSINPGSSSTKLGIFQDGKLLVEKIVRHSHEELAQYPRLIDQLDFRLTLVQATLKEEGLSAADFAAIVARGGLLRPIEGGLYEVNEAMCDDLAAGRYGTHASNLGALLARKLAPKGPCYIADPVVVDELAPVARISGHPDLPRRSIFHALNQKAMARRYADEIGRPYNSLKLIVAHLGGGISVGLHVQGKVIDVNNALDGEGPLSPERSGTLEFGQVIRDCFHAGLDAKALMKKYVGQGGLVAHLGSNNTLEVLERIEAGDAKAALVFDAMAYQVAKSIGALATVAEGQLDQILLTGGLAYSERFCEAVRKRVAFIAGLSVYPGEDELEALAAMAQAYLEGRCDCRSYS